MHKKMTPISNEKNEMLTHLLACGYSLVSSYLVARRNASPAKRLERSEEGRLCSQVILLCYSLTFCLLMLYENKWGTKCFNNLSIFVHNITPMPKIYLHRYHFKY